MSKQTRSIILNKWFLIATILRLCILWSPLFNTPYPTSQPYWEGLSSALTHSAFTFDHLRQGLFLRRYQPELLYDSLLFQLPPLALASMEPWNDRIGLVLFGLVCTAMHVAISLLLSALAQHVLKNTQEEQSDEKLMENTPIYPDHTWIFGVENSSKPCLVSLHHLPQLLALCYYCNPCSVLSPSFQHLPFLMLLSALHCANKRIIPLAVFFLSIGVYFQGFFCLSFLFPVAISAASNASYKRTLIGMAMFLCLWTFFLSFLSHLFIGNWSFLRLFSSTTTLHQRQPSLSLLWYFSLQLFHRFRYYFQIVLFGLPYIFILPLTTRLYRYPIELTTLLLYIQSQFNPVFTLNDASNILLLLCLSPRSIIRMRSISLISLFALLIPASLFVVDHFLWLRTNTGNANYLFFQCLVFQVFFTVIALDFWGGTLKRDKARRLVRRSMNL